ncbi:MAG TPA: alpha/beta fold hydrolase [Acidimicrobiales bacterium]|jgi:pimeloyl-ACP methyl ester carboxylesterase|nr:alpha/beta fold hydrolase [Acidimicrobiales bacterium]
MNRLLLVHGAFHGAWCWDRLGPELDARDIAYEAVELPFTTPDADADTVRTAADRLASGGGAVTVMGHSFGGAVISAAAIADGRPYGPIRSLIYLTAIMTAPGQNVDFSGGTGMAAIDLSGETARFDRTQAYDAFYNRCTREESVWAAGRLRDMPTALLITRPPEVPAWKVLPSTYVICTDDHVLSTTAQETMAANAGSTIRIDSDHSPFLSCPALLADHLLGVLDAG